jgi:hypothetical protein
MGPSDGSVIHRMEVAEGLVGCAVESHLLRILLEKVSSYRRW